MATPLLPVTRELQTQVKRARVNWMQVCTEGMVGAAWRALMVGQPRQMLAQQRQFPASSLQSSGGRPFPG